MTHETLPFAILNSNEYKGLTQKQKKSFEQRLFYIEEVIVAIKNFKASSDKENRFFDFRDDLELDIFAIHSLGEKSDISSWLIHSAWPADLDINDLRQLLDSNVQIALDKNIPILNDGISGWIKWLEDLEGPLSFCLKEVYEPANFADAVSNLIALDALLIKVLFGFCKLRLIRHAG